MFKRKNRLSFFILCLLNFILVLSQTALAQSPEAKDEEIIERYKLMLERKPKEGNTFDRLYHYYVEGAGLERMAADYQAEADANPNNPNLQLIFGTYLQRLGKNAEAIAAYKRAIELAPNDYYSHFALGQAYATLHRHEDVITTLTRASEIATVSKTASLDESIALYKVLGSAYFNRDLIEEAISAWAKSLKLTRRTYSPASNLPAYSVNRISTPKPLNSTRR